MWADTPPRNSNLRPHLTWQTVTDEKSSRSVACSHRNIAMYHHHTHRHHGMVHGLIQASFRNPSFILCQFLLTWRDRCTLLCGKSYPKQISYRTRHNTGCSITEMTFNNIQVCQVIYET